MSEKETNLSPAESGEEAQSALQPQAIELIVNKTTGDIVFKSSDGQTITAKATVLEEGEGEHVQTDAPPLTPEQFREALQRLSDLGLTWTADTPTRVKPKNKENDSALLSAEFERFQYEYPTLPREVSLVAFQYLTGREDPKDIASDAESLKKKFEIAKEFYLNEEYRAEFFFKHAIKVPYFSDFDWEVIIKAYEKNVNGFPGIAYALLSLRLGSPDRSRAKSQTITVAANLAIVEKLLVSLGEVKKALESTQILTNALHTAKERADLEREQNAHPNDTTEKVG